MTTPTNPAGPAASAGPAAPTSPDNSHPYAGHVIAPEVDNSIDENTPAPVVDERYTALETQFNTLREEAQAREQRLTETIQQLMMRPVGYPTQPAPAGPTQPEGLDFSDLPDPVQNPKDYNTQLQSRINSYLQSSAQANQRAVMSQMTQAQAINGLWNRFATEQPDLAKRQILLQGAAAAEFNDLRAQGIDPVYVAQANPDSIIGNIVRRMNAELGTTSPTAPTAPTAPTWPNNAARADVHGGSQPATPTAPTTQKPRGFVDQIKQMNLKDGLI